MRDQSGHLHGTHPSYTRDGFCKVQKVGTNMVFKKDGIDARGMVASGQYEFVGRDTPSVDELLQHAGSFRLACVATGKLAYLQTESDRDSAIKDLCTTLEQGPFTSFPTAEAPPSEV